MTNHVETSDALFNCNNDFVSLEKRPKFINPSTFGTTWTLSSKVSCYFTIKTMHDSLMKKINLNFNDLMSNFLDMYKGFLAPRKRRKTLTLDCIHIELYRTLTIDDYDTSGK